MTRTGMVCGATVTILFAGGCSSNSSPGSGSQMDSIPTVGPVPTIHIDRSHLTNVQGTIDYSDGNYWVCRPGNDKDECHDDLTATETKKDKTTDVVARPPAAATSTAFDCFYVYPTVDLTGPGNMTDFSDVSLVLDPLLSQAAPFAGICTVYAPLYRQSSLGSGGGDGGIAITGDANQGITDVEAAFDYYMANLNHGRNFVLMGHSQGTFALTKLIQDKLDTNPDLRSHMISALLIGGAVTVPTGAVVGGSFQNISLCTTAGQTGCVIAYNSFAAEAPPPANAVFGKAAAGSEIACTAPALLANNTGRLKGSYSPAKSNQPLFIPDLPMDGIDEKNLATPFGLYRDFFRGTCVSKANAHYYEISVDKTADDQRPTPKYRGSTIEAIGFGLHISDFNLSTDDLIDAVKLQAAAMRK